jgi:hypothetical protein
MTGEAGFYLSVRRRPTITLILWDSFETRTQYVGSKHFHTRGTYILRDGDSVISSFIAGGEGLYVGDATA